MEHLTILEINLPGTTTKDEAMLLLALKMYEVGKISLGQAAKMAGFSKRTFPEILDRYQIPVFNYSGQELREELSL